MPLDLLARVLKRGPGTKFIVEAVREKLEREERAEIEESLHCLGQDPEASDISDFEGAQRRVMTRGN